MNFIKLILTLAQQLTPGDLLDLFPIEERYKIFSNIVIDYNTSLSHIKEYGLERPIEYPLILLWHYNNKDTGSFVFNCHSSILNLAKSKGCTIIGDTIVSEEDVLEKSQYIEKFQEEIKIGPCRVHRDLESRAYLMNKEGKSIELKRQFPGYLKPVNKEV